MLVLSIWFVPVIIFVLFAFRQRSKKMIEQDSARRSLGIHKERLSDLAAQFQAGELSEEEYQSFKLEEEKALLADSEREAHLGDNKTQVSYVWVGVVSLVAMAIAYYTYGAIGAYDAVQVREQFRALSQSQEFDAEQVNETLTSYEDLLEKNPEDIEGWFRLARMQIDMESFDSAIASFNHVLTELRRVEHRAEDEATVLSYIGQAHTALGDLESALVAYEESLGLTQNDAALGMAGRLSYELGDFQKAIDYWTRLKLRNPEADSAVMDDFIERAKTELAALGIDYEAAQPTRIVVNIDLPAAWEGLEDSAALFVYARPVGQRMPLAVKRIPISAQNMTVLLSDEDAMGPMGGISGQDVVEVTARISLTGIANTQPGDWGGNTEIVELVDKETFIDILIEQP